MRDTFIELLRQKAVKDPNVLLVTGDLGFGVLDLYRKSTPNQFINAGIAEQNMTGMAAGLAFEGYRVFTYSIGNFCSLRCLEQLRNDICYHDANVKIISVGSGLGYGSLGMSHHATEDVAILRALPNLRVYSPADFSEVRALVEELMMYNGPAYIRLGRVELAPKHQRLTKINCCNPLNEHDKQASCVLLTHGTTGNLAKNIAEQLPFPCAVYTIPQLKPLPESALCRLLENRSYIVSLEEHNLCGGFGSAIGEFLLDHGINIPLIRLGIQDQYISVGGTPDELKDYAGLSVSSCVKKVLEYVTL